MALDPHRIIKLVFDDTNDTIAVIDQGAATAPQPDVYLSDKQIIKRVYDAINTALKTVSV
jgi:hypothetical protein